MPEPVVDHRQATAQRNAAAILDATERLLAARAGLSMAAIAVEAGVSRPTLYAHFRTLPDVVEAVVARAVEASICAIDEAEPERGAADAALDRVLAASWKRLGGLEALTAGAAEHLPANHLHRTHRPLLERVERLAKRGQAEGVFRARADPAWLATAVYALIHAADGYARTHRVRRDDGLRLLRTAARALLGAPPA